MLKINSIRVNNPTTQRINPKNLAQESLRIAQKMGIETKTLQDRLAKAKMSGLNLTNPQDLQKAIAGDFESRIVSSKCIKRYKRDWITDSYGHYSNSARIGKTLTRDQFDSGIY